MQESKHLAGYFSVNLDGIWYDGETLVSDESHTHLISWEQYAMESNLLSLFVKKKERKRKNNNTEMCLDIYRQFLSNLL